MFDPHDIRQDFPIFQTKLKSGKPLVYLDSAATSQKPQVVLDAIRSYYENDNANVHRGVHELGDRATKAWMNSRETIASFFGAAREELVMVRNTTEALNMVAYSWGEEHIGKGDLLLATQMDHHSNFVPWQQLAKRKGATYAVVPVTKDGMLNMEWLERNLKEHGASVKIVAIPHVSNTLGTINPVEEITKLVHHLCPHAVVVVDGAQAAPHMRVDFHAIGAEFYAVSAHKMLGPMGVGGLFVRRSVLEKLSPYLFGGGMIGEVGETETTFSEDLEDRFTAGTPDVAGAVGWAAACRYLVSLGMEHVAKHDHEMTEYAMKRLSEVSQVTIVGPRERRAGSVAFLYKGVHSHDVAQVLDSEGVAVRSGHHCTMPLHTAFGWAATTRLSFNVYTTTADVDVLIASLAKVANVFGTE